MTLPLVGSASLEEIRQAMNSGVRNIDRLARQALAGGNLAAAEKLIGEALRQDPNDSEALALQAALAKQKQGGGNAKVADGPAVEAGRALRRLPGPRPAPPAI